MSKLQVRDLSVNYAGGGGKLLHPLEDGVAIAVFTINEQGQTDKYTSDYDSMLNSILTS